MIVLCMFMHRQFCVCSLGVDTSVCVVYECAIVYVHGSSMDDSVCVICECAIICEHSS